MTQVTSPKVSQNRDGVRRLSALCAEFIAAAVSFVDSAAAERRVMMQVWAATVDEITGETRNTSLDFVKVLTFQPA